MKNKCCGFDNQRVKLAKNGKVLITELSTKVKVEIAPFEATKIVLVVFVCVLPANSIKWTKKLISCCF